MFQTEKLTQIIDQLRNTEGMGYFDTLKLVLQLIGIFIGPVLILAVLIFIWINNRDSSKMDPCDSCLLNFEPVLICDYRSFTFYRSCLFQDFALFVY